MQKHCVKYRGIKKELKETRMGNDKSSKVTYWLHFLKNISG